MQELRQSTEIKVRVGPFVDVGDGFTPETGVTLGGADEAELLKQNGAATVDISAATWAAITGCDGWYDLTLTTSHTDTLGQLTVVVHDDSVCLPVFRDFQVVTANYWDSKYSTDYRQVDVVQVGGDTQSATDLKDFADAGYDPSTNKVQGVVLTDTCTTNTDMRGTDSAALASVCTEARLSELDAGISGKAANQIDLIKTDTAEIGIAGAGLTNINLPNQTMDITGNITGNLSGSIGSVTGDVGGNVTGSIGSLAAQAKADVNAEVDTALTDIDLDHLIQVTAGAEEPTDGSYLDQIMHKNVSQTFDATTDSLEALRDTDPLGTAMRGTDSAALASVCTEARLAELDAANLPADIDTIKADLPQKITKNTALNNFEFLMVDSTDHITPKTSLAVTANRSIDGGAFGGCTNSVSELSNGVYKINLAAADLDGDVITLRFTASGADDRLITIVTQPT